MRSGARGLVASRWHGCCHGVLPHAPSLAWLLAHLAQRRLAHQRRAVAARARRRRRCAACAQRCRAVRRAEQGRGARGGRGRHRVRFWDRGGGAAPRHSRTLWYSIRNDGALHAIGPPRHRRFPRRWMRGARARRWLPRHAPGTYAFDRRGAVHSVSKGGMAALGLNKVRISVR